MVLTVAQVQAFFTTQMGLNASQIAFLTTQGIVSVSDLAEFGRKDLKALQEQSTKPTYAMNNQNVMVTAPGCNIPILSVKKLAKASEGMQYYSAIGHTVVPNNISYNVLKLISDAYGALETKRDNSDDWPKIRGSKILEFLEEFKNRCVQQSSSRQDAPGPISYVIRDDANVPASEPRQNNRPYPEVHGSVAAELTARMSHDHALFSDDNQLVFMQLSKGLAGSAYLAAIQTFENNTDGRGAYEHLQNVYAGSGVRQQIFSEQEKLISTGDFTGTNPAFPLSKLIEKHRNAYSKMVSTAPYITPPPQLMNEHSRVVKFLERVKSTDAQLQAAVALVTNDKTPITGMYNDFETMATFLQDKCPIVRVGTTKKRNHMNISSMEVRNYGRASNIQIMPTDDNENYQVCDATASVNGQTIGFGIGKTGVHLRYHDRKEYSSLSTEQKDELREYRMQRSAEGLGKHLPGAPPKRQRNSDSDRPSKRHKNDIKAAAIAYIEAMVEEQQNENALSNAMKNVTFDGDVPPGLPPLNAQVAATTATVPEKPPSITLQSLVARIKSNNE